MSTELDDALDKACRVMFAALCVAAAPIEWLDDRIGPVPTVFVGLATAAAATFGLEHGLHELHRHLQAALEVTDPLR